jgi:uncharacterized membrane protein YidH (DUF202 family)
MSQRSGRPPGPADDLDADPGLARERTELAWTRSAIAFVGLGAAIVKSRPAVGIPVMAIGIAVWLVGHLPPRHGPASTAGLGARRVLLVTVAVTGLALAALVLTFAGSSRGLRP